MAGENYTNTASTATTTTPVGPADPTATFASFSGWPSAPFWGEFEKGTASAEIVRVTNVAGSTLTMTRGQGGTAATSHGAGVTFEHVVPADPLNRFELHSAASTAVHGVSGSVVGTTGAQTIADKLLRGAAKSQNSDALPVGITASFENVADNSSARDGFVHRNTAGHVDRRGFLLEQSGTPRVQAFNDGTVDIAPGASARPGFRNHGTTTLDGAVTANSTIAATGAITANGGISTSGMTVTTSGIVVTGGAIVSGNTQFNNNVAATGTIHSNGSIDTDTNLTVDGTSTLTGAVTTGSTLAVTQGITSWGSRVPMSVATSAAVTTPVTGDLIWDRSVKLWKEWSGSTWAVVDRPYAQMRQTVSQNFSTATFTAVTFTTEDFDNVSGHSTSSNTSRYTCQTGFDGVYELAGHISFATNTTGSRTSRWTKNGSVLPASQAPGFDANATSFTSARTILVRLVVGDFVELEGYQSSGVTLGTNVTGEFQSYMSVKWMAP